MLMLAEALLGKDSLPSALENVTLYVLVTIGVVGVVGIDKKVGVCDALIPLYADNLYPDPPSTTETVVALPLVTESTRSFANVPVGSSSVSLASFSTLMMSPSLMDVPPSPEGITAELIAPFTTVRSRLGDSNVAVEERMGLDVDPEYEPSCDTTYAN